MHFYSYDYLGVTLEPQIEFEINVEAQDISLKVNAIMFEGEDICMGKSPSVRALGKEIKAAVEADWEWIETRAYQAGWTWKTRGGTDPEARWVNRENCI